MRFQRTLAGTATEAPADAAGFARTIAAQLDDPGTLDTVASDATASATDATLAAEHARAHAAEPASSPEGAPPPSGTASRYEVLGLLGEGGMGRVYEARDTQFGRTVALKELASEQASSAMLRRFLQEAVVTANLEHPGVVPVYERVVRDGRPCYAMRRLAGKTFAEALAQATSYAERVRLLPSLVRVAQTLAFAHERGVVHRDLKPDNVLLGAYGEVTVIDWGIARVLRLETREGEGVVAALPVEAAPQGATLAGSVLGTPSYMPPEQAQGRVHEIDERADVFALGAMLYELLTGRAPYRGRTALETLREAVEARYESIDRAAPDVPAALRACCAKALSPKRDERYRNAAEFARALEAYTSGALAVVESRVVRYATNASLAVVVAVLGLALLAAWKTAAGLREQGIVGYLLLALAALDGALLALELRTEGRYQLAGVGRALAWALSLVGLSNTALGLGLGGRALGSERLAANAERYRSIAGYMLYEALGSAGLSLALTALLLLLWALVARAHTRRSARAATPVSVGAS